MQATLQTCHKGSAANRACTCETASQLLLACKAAKVELPESVQLVSLFLSVTWRKQAMSAGSCMHMPSSVLVCSQPHVTCRGRYHSWLCMCAPSHRVGRPVAHTQSKLQQTMSRLDHSATHNIQRSQAMRTLCRCGRLNSQFC